MKLPWKAKSGEAWLTAVALVLGLGALGGGVALTMARNNGAAQPSSSRLDGVADLTKRVSKPLPIGRVAKLGSDYSVTVTDATVYTSATEQYIVATLKATYTGKGEGDPTEDLAAAYSTITTSKTAANVESACVADFGEPDLSVLNAAGQAKLADGDSRSYVVCIDLPTKKVDDGQVSIEASASGDLAFWATKGADSKDAPKPAPKPVPKPAVDRKKIAKQLDEVEDQLDDAKDARDELDDLIDDYKDLPGHKKKKLKKMEDMKDDYDDVIDQLEKAKKILGG